MMLYPAMNKLLEKIPSRYLLVNVVAQRARQIASEAEEDHVSLEEKPVTLAIREVADGKERPVVVDLCSGSGCLAVSVACEYEGARVYAVEKYDAALSYLRRNVKLNQADVKIVQGDVLTNTYAEPIPEADLVLCNPPYLTEEDMKHLQKEVTFEPASALYGEAEDGLTFYRAVSSGWRKRIRSGGMLAFEIGMGQEQAVKQILQKEGYQNICTVLDACGIIRVLTAVRP